MHLAHEGRSTPHYQRITFAIFGIATPSDVIRDRTKTPFNIGQAIELTGFEWVLDSKTLASASEDKTVILWNLEQSVELDKVVAAGCDWVRDYLRTNVEVKEEDRHLCDSVSDSGRSVSEQARR